MASEQDLSACQHLERTVFPGDEEGISKVQCHICGAEWEDVPSSIQIRRLETELIQLRTWQAQAMPSLKEFTALSPLLIMPDGDNEKWTCAYCPAEHENYRDVPHTSDCPYRVARQLLSYREKKERE